MSPPILRTFRAKKAFKDFTGRSAKKVVTSKLDDKDQVGYRLGPMVGVAYEATRDGKTERYFHEFKKAARPDLISRDDGKQLYIDGGKYRVTDRGIEDMPALFVVNPSVRPSKRFKTKGRTTMARTHRRRRRRPVTIFQRNPAPARRRRRIVRTHKRRRTFMSNPAPVRRRRRLRARSFRRNPIRGSGHMSMKGILLPAVGIGLGAVGSELLIGYLPLPAQLKTGIPRQVAKGVISLAAGWLISKFINKRAGEAFAMGGIAIAVHDAAKTGILQVMPSAQFGYYSPGAMLDSRQMGQYLPRNAGSPGMGQYVPAFNGAGRPMSSDGGGSPSFGV